MELALSLSTPYLGSWVDLTKFLSLLMSGAKQEVGVAIPQGLFSQGFPHPSLGAPNGPARVGIECGFVNFLCSFSNMEERWEERVRMELNLV